MKSIKTPITPLIIEVNFYPEKYEFADCTILGDFAYISYLCLLIYYDLELQELQEIFHTEFNFSDFFCDFSAKR